MLNRFPSVLNDLPIVLNDLRPVLNELLPAFGVCHLIIFCRQIYLTDRVANTFNGFSQSLQGKSQASYLLFTPLTEVPV